MASPKWRFLVRHTSGLSFFSWWLREQVVYCQQTSSISLCFPVLGFQSLEGGGREARSPCPMVTHILIWPSVTWLPSRHTGLGDAVSCVSRKEGKSKCGWTLLERIREFISLLIFVQEGLIFWRHVQRREYIGHLYIRNISAENKTAWIRGPTAKETEVWFWCSPDRSLLCPPYLISVFLCLLAS